MVLPKGIFYSGLPACAYGAVWIKYIVRFSRRVIPICIRPSFFFLFGWRSDAVGVGWALGKVTFFSFDTMTHADAGARPGLGQRWRGSKARRQSALGMLHQLF